MYLFVKRLIPIFFVCIIVFIFLITANQQYAAYVCTYNPPNSSTPNNTYHDKYGEATGQCLSNQYCKPGYIGSNESPCVTISNCTCDSGQNGKEGGSFSCNGGEVKRTCGSPLICNNYGPKQGNLWPCSPGFWDWSASKNDCIEGLTGFQTKSECLAHHGQPQCPNGISGTCMQSNAVNVSLCLSQGNQNRGTCTGNSNYFCCAPAASSSNPCSNVGNGMYCGGSNGNTGTKGTLYDCENHQVASSKACGTPGCHTSSNPYPDYCNGTSSGGGGGSGGGNGGTKSFPNHLDGANCSTGISGWVCQSGYFDKANTVHLYADNSFDKNGKHLYPNTTANLEKGSSISSLCGGTTKHAFNFPASQLIHDGKEHNYYVYGIDLSGANHNPLLYPSPVKVTCSATNPSTSPSPSGQSTSLKIVLGLSGMGVFGNNPKHFTRPVAVELYAANVKNPGNPGTKPLAKSKGTVTYDSASDNNAGYFVSNTPISFPNLATGQYQVLIKIPRYLYKLATNSSDATNPTVFTLTANTTTVLNPVTLIGGNVQTANGHINHLNITDYNVILSCYGDKAKSSSCPVGSSGPDGTNLADLNDDGVIDIVDLNIWLRSLSSLQASNAIGCDQGDCQGD